MNSRTFTLSIILCALFSFGFNSIEGPSSESLDQASREVFFP
ncbi:MAG: hypothetical protein ACJAQ4_002708, partial [Cryomorphaceae bacterium]